MQNGIFIVFLFLCKIFFKFFVKNACIAAINLYNGHRCQERLITKTNAQVVKLVDTRDLKSLGLNIRAGSTPALGTT